MSQQITARIITFNPKALNTPLSEEELTAVIATQIPSDIATVGYMSLTKDIRCTIVDLDGAISSFFDPGETVDKISEVMDCWAVMVYQEGFFLPSYNFVFSDATPQEQTVNIINMFYSYLIDHINGNQADAIASIKATW